MTRGAVLALLLLVALAPDAPPALADGLGQGTTAGTEDTQNPEDANGDGEADSEDPNPQDKASQMGSDAVAATSCDDRGEAGEPVSLYDGRMTFVATDLVVNGLYPILVNRRYDSRSHYDSPVGYGWSIQHDRRLYQYPDGSVIIRYGCGLRDRFVYTGGAYVTPTGGREGDLVENPDGSFVYTRQYATKEFYDSQGRLEAVQNRHGHRHEYTYDPAGKLPLTGTSPFSLDPAQPMTVAYNYRLTRIDERAADGILTGNFVTLAYDPSTGRLQSITSSDGRTVAYAHEPLAGLTSGNLAQVNGLEGVVSTYLYADPNDPHNLTSIQEQSGDTPWVTTYDTQDRVVQQSHGADLYAFTYVIDLTETLVTHTIRDASGQSPYATTKRYFFDANGNVERSRDALGNEIVYTRDGSGHMATKSFWENRGTLPAPNLVLERTVTFGHDSLGRRTSESVTLDSGETVTRAWTWDGGWLASEQVVSDTAPAKIFRTEYTFFRDGSGAPTQIQSVRRRKDDGSFQVTAFSYDAKNRLVSTTLPDGQVVETLYEAGSLFPTRRYYEVDGGGTPVESPYGRMRFGYDAKGNVSHVWDPLDHLTTYAYDDRHRVVQVTNALGQEEHYTYAGLHLTQIEQGRTIADGPGQMTRFGYAPEGWLVSIEEIDESDVWHPVAAFTHDSAGNRLSSTDALGRTTTYQYDLLGRTEAVTDPASKTTTFDYDMFHQRVGFTDAAGRYTATTYDDLGRATSVDQQGVSPSAVTAFSYDAAGNLLTVTDAESHTTTYTVDALSRVTAITQPLGQTVQKLYDDRERISEVINARGNRIVHTYDPWGTLTQTRYFTDTADPTADRTVDYVYNHDLDLVSVSDSSVQVGPLYTYAYDEIDRAVSTVAKYIPGGDRTLVYGYDRYGNRETVQLVDGTTFDHTYQYDRRNRLTTAVLPGSQTFSATYYETGQLQQLTYPNGIVADYAYEANGPVQSIVYSGTSGTIEQFLYSYDDVRNVLSRTELEGTTSFSYDGLDRLTGADHPASSPIADELYSYDRVGNREDPSDANLYVYDANDRITASPGFTYAFDEDGNMTGRSDGRSMSLRHDNRMESITVDGLVSMYWYDPFGRRIGKRVAGVETWFLWAGTRLIAEFDENGIRSKRYAYLAGDYAASQVESELSLMNVHADSTGSPRVLTSSSQEVSWRLNHAAFGGADVDEDVDGDSQRIELNQRFQGQIFDSESLLHYNLHRYYDPFTGRYLSADPLPLPSAVSTYTYSWNAPTKFSDPYGLLPAPPLLEAGLNVAVRIVLREADRSRRNQVPDSLTEAVGQGGKVLPLEKSGLHMFGEDGIEHSNLKLVFPDGREGVYSGDTGRLVSDPANRGTYNFVDPEKTFGHAIKDILPYLLFGTGSDDPTTLSDRVEMGVVTHFYLKDIEGSELRQSMVDRVTREQIGVCR